MSETMSEVEEVEEGVSEYEVSESNDDDDDDDLEDLEEGSVVESVASGQISNGDDDEWKLSELSEVGLTIAWDSNGNGIELGVIDIVNKNSLKGDYLVPVVEGQYVGKWRRCTEYNQFIVSQRNLSEPGHIHPGMIAALVDWKDGDNTTTSKYSEHVEMTEKEWEGINQAINDKYDSL